MSTTESRESYSRLAQAEWQTGVSQTRTPRCRAWRSARVRQRVPKASKDRGKAFYPPRWNPSRMAEPQDLLHRSRFLAKTVLVGAAVLLVLLVAIPFVVSHQSLPEPIIVFVSLFILIAALVAGTAAAYLFMSRSPTGPPLGPVPIARPGGSAPAPTGPELEDLVIRLLDGDERRLMRVILEHRGDVLQRDLIGATAFSDAKVSRLLDRLEERGLVVRERQGMTNRVRLTLRQK